MAILRFEPFSETTTPLDIFDTVTGTITISSASARFSGGNAQGASFPQNAWGEMNFGANPGPTIFISFAAKLGALPGNNRSLFHFKDSSTVQCSLGVDTVGRLQFYRGAASTGTAIGSNSGGVMVGTQWHRYEVKIKIDGSVGTIEVRLDGSGTAAITATGLNTRSSANSFLNIIRIGDCDGGLSSTSATLFSDVIIYTDAGAVPNAFLGDRKLITLKPNGGGSSTQFTPSAGSNFQCVDDIPPNDDTDYVSDNTPGDKDFYDIENPTFTGSADFVGQIYRARKDDAAVHTMRGNYSSSGNVANGATNTLTSSYKYYGRDEVLVNDPNTGVPFVQAGVTALQIGPEIVS